MENQKDCDEFSLWLGNEFQNLIQIQDASTRFDEGKNIVSILINKYTHASANERKNALDSVIKSHEKGKIGNFIIDFDKRNEYDTIEAILSTIEAYLVD